MESFEEIYRKYFDDVYRFLRGLTGNESLAEELTQETFFRAMKSIKDYRGESELRVWMCSIARNLYYSHCRKQNRLSPDEIPNDIADDNSFTDMIADQSIAFQIHRLLHDMQDPYKEVFTLRIFGELSFQKIGQIFGKTENWARVTYHRARLKIQERMNINE